MNIWLSILEFGYRTQSILADPNSPYDIFKNPPPIPTLPKLMNALNAGLGKLLNGANATGTTNNSQPQQSSNGVPTEGVPITLEVGEWYGPGTPTATTVFNDRSAGKAITLRPPIPSTSKALKIA